MYLNVLLVLLLVRCSTGDVIDTDSERERQNRIDQYVNEIIESFEEDLDTLSEGLSINEDILEITRNNFTFPSSQELAEALRSKRNLVTDTPMDGEAHENLENLVFDSLYRILRFYGSHMDHIKKEYSSLSLKMFKDIDDKHGKIFQKDFPLEQWIKEGCDAARIDGSSDEDTFCDLLCRQWKNRSGGTSGANMDYWKAASILQNYLDQVDDATIEQIGEEKEGLWGKLNGQCQGALVSRCEFPYICERTLLDPTPRSQYLLTHQIFQRLMVENAGCPKSFVTDEKIYANMCVKSYMEAQFLDLIDVPINNRDLFAELVGFCALVGYTNFLREDWLLRILSWQSQSDYGCFIRDRLSPVGLLSTDMGFKRKATPNELDQGIEQPKEKCLPHLTAVAMTVVSVYYDYFMDAKSYHLKVGDRSEL